MSRRSSVTKNVYKDFVMALMVPVVSSPHLRPSEPTSSQKSMENMRRMRGERTEIAMKIEAQPMKNSCEVTYLKVSNK